MSSSLTAQMMRTAGLCQALVAVPTLLILAAGVLSQFFDIDLPLYEFITLVCTSLMAACITFILLVQRNTISSPKIFCYFEIAKSALATALWLWLMLDALFGPQRWFGVIRPENGPRIKRAAVSVLLLIFLYYPTLIVAVVRERSAREAVAQISREERGETGERSERTPLLRE